MYLKGKIINERQSNKHFSVGVVSMKKLGDFIIHPTRRLACINDVQLRDDRYVELKETVLASFDARFPQKSKYEL